MDSNSIVLLIAAVIVSYFVLTTIRTIFAIFFPSKVAAAGYQPRHVGEITLEEMSKCTGDDPFRPILVAVKGKIYDVTEARNFYGPGGAYHVYSGREAARALGKMSLAETDCTGEIDDLNEKEKTTLEQWETKFASKYQVVGQVMPPKQLTLTQLAEFDGTDPSKPIYLAVRGVIFDVTSGAIFYGQDGAYPFGGKECSRALAKYSTELKDCNDDLEGCTLSEMDAVRSWEARFHQKYQVVGRIVAEKK